VRAVVGQQVSVKAASTLMARIAERWGEASVTADATLTRSFPRPAVLAEASLEEIGMPGARGRALRSLAAAMAEGRLSLAPGPVAVQQRARELLLSLPGIGPWTTEYIAMRTLRDPDAFPAGDLVLRKICSTDSQPLTTAALAARAECWRPWRAYAVMHLWNQASRGSMGAPRPHR
jgi:3-methyladenine DNA glycosylase/8-oxoguanine DNA glycosylase